MYTTIEAIITISSQEYDIPRNALIGNTHPDPRRQIPDAFRNDRIRSDTLFRGTYTRYNLQITMVVM